jgi:hypothetical protein
VAAVLLAVVVAGTQGGWSVGGDDASRSPVPEPAVAMAGARPVASHRHIGGFSALAARLRTAEPATGELPASVPPEVVAVDEVAIQPLPTTIFEPAPVPEPPPAQLRSSDADPSLLAGGSWALLIGVNDYPGTQYDLRSAVNDVNDVDEALGRLGVPPDRRLVLRDRQATAGTIRAAVDWLTARAGPDATAVFFFAGHIQKLESGNEALVGSDGATVSDVELAQLFDRLQARRTWIGLAGCYSGGFDELARPGRIITAAAPADRLAYENASFGRSYLVEYMVRRGMLGRGLTTVESAFAFAVSELRREHPDRVPVQQDGVPGDLDLRVAPGGPASGSSSPPPPSPPPGDPPPSSPPPPAEDDGCAALTIGMVRCTSS